MNLLVADGATPIAVVADGLVKAVVVTAAVEMVVAVIKPQMAIKPLKVMNMQGSSTLPIGP